MLIISDFIKRWADDEYWNGHLLSTLIGFWGPDVEENIALGSMSQDDLGHARMIYGTYMSPEQINKHIYRTDPAGYQAHPLVMVWEGVDWAFVVLKQFLYKEAEQFRLLYLGKHLSKHHSNWTFLKQMEDEERLHLKHWREWISVLSGSSEGVRRMKEAWKLLYPYALELVDSFTELMPEGSSVKQYEQRLGEVLKPLGLDQVVTFNLNKEISLTSNYESIFNQICREMQSVYRTNPEANWG